MRIKKFNEYMTHKSLSKEDLGMWLRKGDAIKIKCYDGVHKDGDYQIIDFDEGEIEVIIPGTDNNFWLSVDDLNDRWELITINGEPIVISEKSKHTKYPIHRS